VRYSRIIVLVFLHTFGTGRSSLLPLIRMMLHLGDDFSDSVLLSAFTVPTPGHFEYDGRMTVSSMSSRMKDRIADMQKAQQAIADSLIFSHDRHIVSSLSDTALTLVGHGLGAAIAYDFVLHNPLLVRRLVYIGFGEKFKAFPLRMIAIRGKMFQKKTVKHHHHTIQKESEVWKKTLYAMLAETQARGVFDALHAGRNHVSSRLFQKLSIDDQIRVLSIPTRLLCGEKDELVSQKSALIFARMMQGNRLTRKKQKQVLLKDKVSDTFSAKFFAEAGHFLPTTHTADIAQELELFLKHG